MNHQPKTRIHFVGKILLIVGILAFLLGLFLLLFAPTSFSVWLIIASVVINIVGITLMSHKKYE